LHRRQLLGGLAAAASLSRISSAAAIPELPKSRQWAVRTLPAPGRGLTHPLKHVRCAVHPENQRIYFCGGDFPGPGYMQSGRQELYSYSIERDDWRMEHPYCAPPGEIVPFHPDQVGWVWDSKRKVFWMLPGVQFGSSYGGAPCDGKRGVVLGFNSQTRKWTEPTQGGIFKNEYEHSKFAIYDAATDSCVMLGSTESRHWHPADGRWDGVRFGGNRIMLGSYTAQVDRHVYALDFRDTRVVRYQIDQRRIEDGPKLPFDPGGSEMTNLVYARAHRKIFLVRFGYGEYRQPELWSYAPQTETFEKCTVAIPGVPLPQSNTIVYHDGLDVMMLFGHLDNKPDLRFYLYRP
jgi:hypothetical protein